MSKSDKIIGFNKVTDINKDMICKRYWTTLEKAIINNWDLRRLEIELAKSVREFIITKTKMSDDDLLEFFENEKIRNNRKHDASRAVRKFREYSEKSLKDVYLYIDSLN
jgi:hypothetical protein